MVIIETKLHIPMIRHEIVERPLLLAKLDQGLACKATLITAPPGYGKTTIVSEWARHTDVPVAWVSLDQGDNHWIRFWMHLLAALNNKVANFDEQHVYRVASLEDSEESFMAALINSLNRLSEPIAIVLDDFHVIEHAPVLNGLSYLLKWLPKHVHLYFISRIQPKQALSLAKLQMNGEMNKVGVEDLLFTYEEAELHIDRLINHDLSASEKAFIMNRTEGWIAGMRLAGLWLTAKERDAEIIRDITGGQRDIADYFFEEVLSNQSEIMCRFLLETSILERMNSRLCEAVTGLVNSSEILQELDRQNLFIVPLDRHRVWYRYHHLFHEFLSMKLEERGQEFVDKLHFTAGKWLEEHQFLDEAAAQYTAGRMHSEVLRILDYKLPFLADYERIHLHKWLNQVPNEQLIEKPMLYLTNVTALFLSGDVHVAQEKFWWAFHRLEKNDAAVELATHEVEKFRAGLLFIAAFKTYLERDFNKSIQYSAQYIKLDPTGSIFASLGTSGGGHHPMWEIHVLTSRLQTSERTLKELLHIWSRTENAYFYAHLCIDYGRLLYEQDRLEEAEHYLLQTSEIGRAYGNVSLEVMAAILLARVYTAQDRMNMANVLLQSLAEQIDAERYPKYAWKIERFHTLLKWRQGERGKSEEWVAGSGLRADDVIPPSMIEDYEFIARLLAEQQQFEEALDLLERLLRISHKEGRQSDIIRLLTCKSLMLTEQGETLLSMHTLEEALNLGESEGFIRTFLDEGEPLLNVLHQYVQLRQNTSLSYVKRLIGEDGKSTYKTTSLLTTKEREVLQWIDKGLSNKEIAELMDISLSTVKTHVNNMYRKLQVNNRLLAIKRARQLELME